MVTGVHHHEQPCNQEPGEGAHVTVPAPAAPLPGAFGSSRRTPTQGTIQERTCRRLGGVDLTDRLRQGSLAIRLRHERLTCQWKQGSLAIQLRQGSLEKAEGGAQVVIVTTGPTDVGRGGPTAAKQPQAPGAEEQVIRVEGTGLQLVLEGNVMLQKSIVVEGKDVSEETVPQTGEQVPSMSAGVKEGVHVELGSQVVEEMPIVSNGVQEGIHVELGSQVVEEMPTTSNEVQEGFHVELGSQVVEEMPTTSNEVQEGFHVELSSKVVEEMPTTSAGVHVELGSQLVEEMPTMSSDVQVGLVSQVVEEMPGTSDEVQVGSVERDVVEGSQLSVVSAEDQENDMDISLDITTAGEDSVYDLEEVN
ncbi:uncharacterized protein LOC118965363 [Oncorhynchus mykiss]|uniref:uncharacterized protein LOC118965363 n=1 Tax=Oncorhynchus mykiss TaxID=8022 RepID=UPI00187758BC|nr:uncharacterized protein LOC118965363 [Oncorhynchus mykiss]